MSWELYSAQMFYANQQHGQDGGPSNSRLQNNPQMGPDCMENGGMSTRCSRAGCSGARLMQHPGDTTLLATEAELLQQQQQQHAMSQKPYRVGLILLCVGALFNWLGLAQAYVEPMRYIGVGCIVAGALLICAAMCRWLGRSSSSAMRNDHLRCNGTEELSSASRDEQGHVPSIHIISLPRGSPENFQHLSKPPDYESLVAGLPSYEDAIKLRPSSQNDSSSPPSSPCIVLDIPHEMNGGSTTASHNSQAKNNDINPNQCER